MKVISFVALLIILTFIFIRFFLSGPEDDWICQNGQWVKHGNPSSPKPEGDCRAKIVQKTEDQLEDSSICYSTNGNSMTYFKAKEAAAVGCIDGKLSDEHLCNSGTGTWWIDFIPDNPKEGCNPACVVFVDTSKTEINWRCTGLIVPTK